jgi:hypothetical protein
LVTVGRRREERGVGGRIWWKYYILMYENGKMGPVKSILRRGEEGIMENDGGDASS